MKYWTCIRVFNFVLLDTPGEIVKAQSGVDDRSDEMVEAGKLHDLMNVQTDEDKELLTSKVWKTKTKSETEADRYRADLLEKKVSSCIIDGNNVNHLVI